MIDSNTLSISPTTHAHTPAHTERCWPVTAEIDRQSFKRTQKGSEKLMQFARVLRRTQSFVWYCSIQKRSANARPSQRQACPPLRNPISQLPAEKSSLIVATGNEWKLLSRASWGPRALCRRRSKSFFFTKDIRASGLN